MSTDVLKTKIATALLNIALSLLLAFSAFWLGLLLSISRLEEWRSKIEPVAAFAVISIPILLLGWGYTERRLLRCDTVLPIRINLLVFYLATVVLGCTWIAVPIFTRKEASLIMLSRCKDDDSVASVVDRKFPYAGLFMELPNHGKGSYAISPLAFNFNWQGKIIHIANNRDGSFMIDTPITSKFEAFEGDVIRFSDAGNVQKIGIEVGGNSAKQGGTDQPATAPESKSKSQDKPQPESKPAPR